MKILKHICFLILVVSFNLISAKIILPSVKRVNSTNGKVVSIELREGPTILKSEIENYMNASDSGDPYAKYIMGVSYNYGLGVNQSDSLSLVYLIEGAENGILQSSLDAGFNPKLPIDDRIRYLKKAAEGGLSKASIELGQIYEIQHNREEAIEWYKKADEAGMGRFPALKIGVITHDMGNYKDAFKYFQKVTDSKDEDLKYLFLNEESILAEGLMRLGIAYLKGEGTEINNDEAFQCFSKSYEIDPTKEINYWLGYCYENNLGIQQDYKKAFEFYDKSGWQPAKIRLAVLYYYGKGTEQNYKTTVDILKALEAQNYSLGDEGAEILSKCYRFGRGGVTQDIDKADYYFQFSLNARNKLKELENK